MLLEIPPKLSVSSFMGYLKGKSRTMLYEQFVELKYKYRSREFRCRGYYVDTAGKNMSRIAEYIKNQLKEDQMGEQLAISEVGPFKGGKAPSGLGKQIVIQLADSRAFGSTGGDDDVVRGCQRVAAGAYGFGFRLQAIESEKL